MSNMIALFVVALAGVPANTARANPILSADMRAAFANNAALINPLQVTWRRTNTTTRRPSSLLQAIQYPEWSGVTLFSDMFCVYRYQNGMEFESVIGQCASQIPDNPRDRSFVAVPYGEVMAFNGENIYLGDVDTETARAGKIPVLTVDRFKNAVLRKPGHRIFKSEYLRNAGYWTPRYFEDLDKPPEHLVLHILNQGARLDAVKRVVIDGRECLELMVDHEGERRSFACDPANGYVLRRRIDKIAGQVARVLENSDFVHVRGSLWLPKQCQTTFYTWSTISPECTQDPLLVETFYVDELSHETMPADAFMVKYSVPGALVHDTTLEGAAEAPGHQIKYRIPGDTTELQRAIDAAAGRVARRSPGRVWLVLANVVIILVLVVAMARRRLAHS